MTYVQSDPRSALAPERAVDDAIAETQYLEHHVGDPTSRTPNGSLTWIARSQNLVVAYTSLLAGDTVEWASRSEHAVLVTSEDPELTIIAGDDREEIDTPAFVVVPPGKAVLTATRASTIVRILESHEELSAQAVNARTYATPHPRVARTVSSADVPSGGLRVHRLRDIPNDPGRFGRLFRTRSIMVNFLDFQHGPRDSETLSPHHHDDFEQISLAVRGVWTHHVRTPWGPRKSQWREDEHVTVGSPSVTVIPPPTVHTSEAVDTGVNQLIDIFSPPREDFLAQPGWVINAEDYSA